MGRKALLAGMVLALLVSSVAFAGPKAKPQAKPQGGDFVLNANGVVLDKKAKLEWAVGPDTDMDLSEAKAWVEGLTLAGGGWRMPTRAELKGLYKDKLGTRNMPPEFKTTGWWVWTGETGGPQGPWSFVFENGNAFSILSDLSHYGRAFAVRPAK